MVKCTAAKTSRTVSLALALSLLSGKAAFCGVLVGRLAFTVEWPGLESVLAVRLDGLAVLAVFATAFAVALALDVVAWLIEAASQSVLLQQIGSGRKSLQNLSKLT